MVLTAGPKMVVRVRTGVSVIELCEAGRYREAAQAASEIPEGDTLRGLALGMVAVGRDDLERAKDLLTPIAFSDDASANRAKVQLAVAYWRGGEKNEAKDLLKEIPDSFDKLLLKSIIEDRPKYALKVLDRAATYEVRPGLAARLHNQRALNLRKMGETDRAIQEYEAAIFFFQEENSDCLPFVLNNLAGVYLDCKEYDFAHRYLDRAICLLRDDLPQLGKALDQKSQVLLAEGNTSKAGMQSRSAISLLRESGRKEWLVEALLTYAKVLRANDDEKEFSILREAEEICIHLQRNDLLIDVLRLKHDLGKAISLKTEKHLLQTALLVCNGSVRAAAIKLDTTHPTILRTMKRFGLR